MLIFTMIYLKEIFKKFAGIFGLRALFRVGFLVRFYVCFLSCWHWAPSLGWTKALCSEHSACKSFRFMASATFYLQEPGTFACVAANQWARKSWDQCQFPCTVVCAALLLKYQKHEIKSEVTLHFPSSHPTLLPNVRPKRLTSYISVDIRIKQLGSSGTETEQNEHWTILEWGSLDCWFFSRVEESQNLWSLE